MKLKELEEDEVVVEVVERLMYAYKDGVSLKSCPSEFIMDTKERERGEGASF